MQHETFHADLIASLRRRAERAARARPDAPEGWSCSPVDPRRVLKVFDPLRLKLGFTLRAYQYASGGNGNGIVWAMPEAAPFPEPSEASLLHDVFLEPPKPPDALDDVMEAIDGDDTAWSYLCASLLARELGEFGARWHGCSWSTHTVLGENPFTRRRRRQDSDDLPLSPGADWQWEEPEPVEWLPHVRMTDNQVLVTFFTYTGLEVERITRNIDTFERGAYTFSNEQTTVATGNSGYIF